VENARFEIVDDIMVRGIPVEPGYFPARISSGDDPVVSVFGSLFDWSPARVNKEDPPR
jgi:hypothetical protein